MPHFNGSSFLPTSISGCSLWLDANDIATLFTDAGTTNVSADGQSVYQWNDKSGNGRNVLQVTALTRPVYKTDVQNSLPSLRFDGTQYIDSSATFASYPITIIGVAKNGSTTGTTRGVASVYSSVGGGSRVYMNSSNGLTGNVGLASVTKQNLAITINASIPFVFGVQADASNLYTLLNGTSQTNAHTAAGTSQIFRAGGYNINNGATLLDGYVCEVIIYDSLLSAGNLTSVTSYLNSKWSAY